MRAGVCSTILLLKGCALLVIGNPTTPALASNPAEPNSRHVIIVVGAAGEGVYEERFAQWANQWKAAADKGRVRSTLIGLAPTNAVSDLDQLKSALRAETNELTADLWIVLIGHGTFDGKRARFNLRGPDLTEAELAEFLLPVRRPLAVINCGSSSAPFINALSAKGRVIITATRSGAEQNYTRFGSYLSEMIADPSADLDKDGQTSLLEAFLSASRQVAEFYQLEGRLATEHSLLDDNGDGLGTPPDWFRGVRAVKKAKDGATADGFRAHQFHLVMSDAEQRLDPEVRRRRDALEMELIKLRDQKAVLDVDQYYQQLEVLLRQMARIYDVDMKNSE